VQLVRKRAAGGGRKRLRDEVRLDTFPLRISSDLRKDLKQLADWRSHDVSREARDAIKHWIKRGEVRSLPTEAVASAIAVLMDRIEEITNKQWVNNPLTAQLIRERVKRLIAHLIPVPAKPVKVPPEIKEDADRVLTLLKAAVWRPGSPRLVGTVIIDDRGLATTISDLARDVGGAKDPDQFPNVRVLPLAAARREQERKNRREQKRKK
jgi:predicted transcriptional regulator